ncbi:aldo/keto reductase [Flagellimonas sp. HMM57]|uniref:aldo/keto reductase n=1 Tax=unclassified Flagellimonas TaxID=2644544 RepID=UPI0013D1EF15|nr:MULTISPECIES: aldo/keto reductase [unclassified Flagellimonas]UII77323.1 aldo/keto reductase [Flagellimonas sp. HMM57]
MNYRTLGKTGLKVSEISLGTWQVGGKWGSGFDAKNAERILTEAVDNGINFIDTADVYENGKSEQAVGKLIRSRKEKVYIATKCGRFINPHVSEGYQPKVLREYVEQSLKNTGLEKLDLIQLHCPPTEVYYRQEIFEEFEKLKKEGKVSHLGVSVEKVEEALKAIEYPNVSTVQIIFNMFRHRPAELLFEQAKKRNVGIIARVPLASGLLTGKFHTRSIFSNDDHRQFNRKGEAFDQGETFSGIDYNLGLEAVERLKLIFPKEFELVHLAIKWILMFEEVSCVIPGVSKKEQLYSNLEALKLRNLSKEEMLAVEDVYNEMIRPSVHHRW